MGARLLVFFLEDTVSVLAAQDESSLSLFRVPKPTHPDRGIPS